MNKTVSINIGGVVFHIDEQAYEILNQYLESIKGHFQKEAGNEEIIADIESRLAEMLQERTSNAKREVVLSDDINAVIDAMGRPEDFGDVEEEDAKPTSTSRSRSYRRFFRNPDDMVLGGVCSGISAYFNIDPIWLRLAFALGVIFAGTGILIYLLLWLIIPKAGTAAEKLEMRGEAVNLSNIEKTVKDEMEGIKEKLKNIKKDGASGTDKFIGFVSSLFNLLGRALKIAFGIVFVCLGACLLIFFVLSLLGLVGFLGIFLPFVIPMFFVSHLQEVLGIIGLVLLITIPAVAILYKGLQILFGIKVSNRGIGLGFLTAWLIGLVLSVTVIVQLVHDFSKKGRIKQEVEIVQIDGEVLRLEVFRVFPEEELDDLTKFGGDRIALYYYNDQLAFSDIKLDIIRSETEEFELVQAFSARASNKKDAMRLAGRIQYQLKQQDSILSFADMFTVEELSKWRHQAVEMTLKVPTGKGVFITEKMEKIIYDIQNVTNTYDGNMGGHTWMMLKKGLTCIDCSFSSSMSRYDDDLSAETFELESFHNIDISGPFKVVITQDESFVISKSGSERLMEKVEWRIVSNTLKADLDHSFWDILEMIDNDEIKLNIRLPQLKNVELSGATHTRIIGFDAESFNLDLSGATKTTVDIRAESVNVDLSGASKLTLKGHSTYLNADLSGASSLNAEDLITKEAELELTGACKAYVHARDRLTVDATGACHVFYSGNPTMQVETSMASSVSRRR